MSQKHDFSSARRTLDWAKKDIEDFKRAVALFFQTSPYTIREHRHNNGPNAIVVAHFREVPPDDIDRHAVATARNLRAALDQAAWVTAVNSGKSGKTGTHFPFPHTSQESDIRNIRRKGCAQIPDDIFSFFLSFQPYPGGDDLLACLNDIRNTPDHRMIEPMGILASGTFNLTNGAIDFFQVTDMAWIPSTKCIELAFYAGNFDYNGHFTFDIKLNKVAIRKPAAALFDALASKVTTIIDGTEAECRRLGLI